MKNWLLLLMLVIALASPASAQQSTPDDHFGEWMTFYYRDKDSSQTDDFLQWLQTSQILDKNSGAARPLAAFMSIIFADNPTKVAGWLKEDNFTGNTKTAIEMALWLAGNDTELKAFTKNSKVSTKAAPKLTNIPIQGPTDLDMMWGAFQASGNPVYVNKIIDTLGSADILMQGAAEWSLASNMKQHELVNRIAQSESKSRTGVVKQKLDALIAQVSSPAQ
jgi:hypothetical protein